jgi:hypothetical protein
MCKDIFSSACDANSHVFYRGKATEAVVERRREVRESHDLNSSNVVASSRAAPPVEATVSAREYQEYLRVEKTKNREISLFFFSQRKAGIIAPRKESATAETVLEFCAERALQFSGPVFDRLCDREKKKSTRCC